MQIRVSRLCGPSLKVKVVVAMFDDRADAGRKLAKVLSDLENEDLVVLGLPRGGVPLAAVVAAELGAPLDVIVVRKLGLPFSPELAMGAIGEGGVRVLNKGVLRDYGLPDVVIARVEARERAELERRIARFRSVRPRVALSGKRAVIVDDGVATGATARVACLVAREAGAEAVMLAAPVMGARAAAQLSDVADEVVSLDDLSGYSSVSEGYRDFRPVSEDEVVALLTAKTT